MKRRLFAMAVCVVLVLSMSVTAFAGNCFRMGAGTRAGGGSCGYGGYNLMWDANGNFFDKDAFEENLDKAIEDGYISAENREFYVERYDFCSTYGGGATGVRGGGCGRGMMYSR